MHEEASILTTRLSLRPSSRLTPASQRCDKKDTPLRGSPISTAPHHNQDMDFAKLQIEKQHLEIQLMELDAKAKVRSLSSPTNSKPASIPSLDIVHSENNAGKSQSQLDHNTRILNPQEWPHLRAHFSLYRKNLRISRLLNSFMASWTS